MVVMALRGAAGVEEGVEADARRASRRTERTLTPLEKWDLLEAGEGEVVEVEGAAEAGVEEDLEGVGPGSTHERGQVERVCTASGRDT